MIADAPSALEIATLVIAVVGLVLGVVSLVWQMVSWTYEGPRIKVQTTRGFRVSGAGATSDAHVVVTARNVGRSAVELTSWGFDLGRDTTTFMPPTVSTPTRLPSTLAGGHEAKFFLAEAQLKEAVARANTGQQPRAFVTIATGKRCYSSVVKLGR